MRETIFEKNLKAMEQWYPDFADLIRQGKYQEDDTNIRTEQSQDGELIFRIETKEKRLYLGGKRNAKDPILMWQERLGEIHKYAPVFLMGIGSGAYLKSMIQNSPKEANIILYEPSVAVFLAALKEIDLSEEIGNRPIGFVVEGLNDTEFLPVVQGVLTLETLEFFICEVHPNYKTAFSGQLQKRMKQLMKYIERFFVNFNTRRLLQGHAAQNVLYNLPYVAQGYHTMQLSKVIPYKGAAVLVSAGPSLNKNMEQLKRAKNHLFMIAVDTAVKPLLKQGIVPDVFITLDGRKPLELLKGAEWLPVVSNPVARYELLDQQKGKKIFFFDGYQLPLDLYVQNGKVLPGVAVGGSVACSGFSLLYKMGFETVILVGQDLAYTDDKSHADGTFRETMPKENTESMIRVKGNYQDTVPTLTNLKIYLEWFADYIKGAKERGNFRVINATEGGAYIEGTELMTLKDAIDEYIGEETDFSARIETMESAFTAEEKEKAYKSLKEIPKQFIEIEKIAQQLKKEYQRVEKIEKSKSKCSKSYQKVIKKIKKLTDQCHGYSGYQLVEETLGTAEYILQTEFFYDQNDVEANDLILQTAAQGIAYSEVLEECAKLMQELSRQMLERADDIYGGKDAEQ